MANQLYGYTSSYAAQQPSAAAGSIYGGSSSRSLSDPPLSSSLFLTQSETLRFSSAASAISPHSHYLHHQYWPSGVDVTDSDPLLPPGFKRSSEALYHQTVLGAHDTIGQTEAWYSSSSLVKRPKLHSASSVSIYPQRPGEKDCAHYMLTRTCKFGDSCKFDHPIWVPEGGIPDWKEVSLAATSELLPERPAEPDCPYFLKTERCKFGSRCKFNHPKDKLTTLGSSENAGASFLPERPSEPLCTFYMKTGKCKFGATCKFHHPKDFQIASAAQENANYEQTESAIKTGGASGDVKPALYHNSKGLPIRLGEVDCPFYLKTGSCKYGVSCRYNHPDWNAIGHSFAASAASVGVVNAAASMYQSVDPAAVVQSTLGVASSVFPQRPGQTECDYYLKTGDCKFGERCKFHHPIDRPGSTTKQSSQLAVKLTLAGLPRREGAIQCPYYMKTGTCKYGATCKFDHPPPGEVMAMAASQGTSSTIDGEEKGDGTEAETP